MKRTLVDAGPLIALFDKDDQYHIKTVEFLRGYRGRFVTTWPVITETTHMLDFSASAQIDFFKWVEQEGVHIFQLERSHLDRLIYLWEKYSDLPMDLADATLLITAELTGIRTIVSIDRDFNIYRIGKNLQFRNIFIQFN